MTTVQRRGRSHGRGIPAVAVRPIDRSTPARRPRTAPDERPDMRGPPGQRMMPDASRLRPYRCPIIVRVPRTDYRVARPNEAPPRALPAILLSERAETLWHARRLCRPRGTRTLVATRLRRLAR